MQTLVAKKPGKLLAIVWLVVTYLRQPRKGLPVDKEFKQMRELQKKKEETLTRLKRALLAEMFTNGVRYDLAERGALWPEEVSKNELVGILVKNLRLFRGLSGADLAERSGVSLETISRLENGHHKPRQKTIEKLAAALRVKPEQLDPAFVFQRWPAIHQPALSQAEAEEWARERENWQTRIEPAQA
jgi:transcriptional regulator with XRE-family HTH domain